MTADVQAILYRVIRPGEDDEGESVSLIAEKAGISTRTVYRVLSRSTDDISLSLADALCCAADAHLSECRVIIDGEIRQYLG